MITIRLPKLKVTKNIKLDVLDRSLTLKTQNENPNYELSIELPYKTDSSSGANAKYSSVNVSVKISSSNSCLSKYYPESITSF